MATSAAAAKPAESKRILMLDGSRFKLAELERQEWIVNAEESVTLEDVMQPGFFSLVAVKMQPYDHVEVRSDDGKWMANLLVASCGRNWAKTVLLNKFDLSKGPNETYSSLLHEVKWKGPQHKWTVIRIQDGEKLKTGCLTEREGVDWLRAYESNVT